MSLTKLWSKITMGFKPEFISKNPGDLFRGQSEIDLLDYLGGVDIQPVEQPEMTKPKKPKANKQPQKLNNPGVRCRATHIKMFDMCPNGRVEKLDFAEYGRVTGADREQASERLKTRLLNELENGKEGHERFIVVYKQVQIPGESPVGEAKHVVLLNHEGEERALMKAPVEQFCCPEIRAENLQSNLDSNSPAQKI